MMLIRVSSFVVNPYSGGVNAMSLTLWTTVLGFGCIFIFFLLSCLRLAKQADEKKDQFGLVLNIKNERLKVGTHVGMHTRLQQGSLVQNQRRSPWKRRDKQKWVAPFHLYELNCEVEVGLGRKFFFPFGYASRGLGYWFKLGFDYHFYQGVSCHRLTPFFNREVIVNSCEMKYHENGSIVVHIIYSVLLMHRCIVSHHYVWLRLYCHKIHVCNA